MKIDVIQDSAATELLGNRLELDVSHKVLFSGQLKEETLAYAVRFWSRLRKKSRTSKSTDLVAERGIKITLEMNAGLGLMAS